MVNGLVTGLTSRAMNEIVCLSVWKLSVSRNHTVRVVVSALSTATSLEQMMSSQLCAQSVDVSDVEVGQRIGWRCHARGRTVDDVGFQLDG
jgi:hypothetical protein